MADYLALSFAFFAGVFAFFSPCAVVLLPGYVTYFLSKKIEIKNHSEAFIQALLFSLLSILGFFTVFGISGFLVIAFGQFVKRFIPYIAVITGTILIVIGLSILFGKHISLRLPSLRINIFKDYFKSYPWFEAYLFGISYAIAALGCVFPLFLTVVLQGIIANTYIDAVYYILAYIAGISLLMLAITIAIVFARKLISEKLNHVVPYVEKASGVILIFAGSYMVYYQRVYF